MRIVMLVLLAVFGMGAESPPESQQLSFKDVGDYFASIGVQDGNFIFVRKAGQGPMLLDLNRALKPVSIEGAASFTIEPGSSFRLYTRHAGTDWTTLPSAGVGRGFLVTTYFDARSFGAERRKKTGIVLISEGAGKIRIIILPADSDIAGRAGGTGD